MKKTLIFIALCIAMASCKKEDEPCISLDKVVCTHNIINSWRTCPSHTTGLDSIYSHSGEVLIDTVGVCDVDAWLKEKNDWNAYQRQMCIKFSPQDLWLMDAFPSTCGCE